MHFDVFNGDADGIIALVQLRLAEPKESILITGVKRDISLLKQVDIEKASSVTVLDISLEKNVQALEALLNQKTHVLYVDHHRTGEIPRSSRLKTRINTDANTCTSLLVNDMLNNQYVNWAIAAAFGDNMNNSATKLAESVGLTSSEQQLLKELGVYINYNGYGREVSDLHFSPEALYQLCLKYEDPLILIEDPESVFHHLKAAYEADMKLAKSSETLFSNEVCRVIQLNDAPWARRVSGVYGNELANKSPDKAHVIVTLNADGNYTISIRAPLSNKQGADIICSQFPTGGGRAAAAGVNSLPKEMLERFIETVSGYYGET
jgi:hypothetical protein